MKMFLITFLMTIVAVVSFSSNTIAAHSKTTYPIFDLQEEDAWNLRLNELKDAGRGIISENDVIRLAHIFIPESDKVIVVDLREGCNGLSEYLGDGFHGLINQTTGKLEENENECLRETLKTLHIGIEDGEYQISQFNLDTLQAITEDEFLESFEHRYVSFQIVGGNLENGLLVDQFLQHTFDFSTDYRIHVRHLPSKEKTTTLFFLLDVISSEEKFDYKQQRNNNVFWHVSNFKNHKTESVSRRSEFVKSQPVSYVIYDKLLCSWGIGAGVSTEWGGNEGAKTTGFVTAGASDDRGNYVRGNYERDGDRNRASAETGHEDRGRGRDK